MQEVLKMTEEEMKERIKNMNLNQLVCEAQKAETTSKVFLEKIYKISTYTTLIAEKSVDLLKKEIDETEKFFDSTATRAYRN